MPVVAAHHARIQQHGLAALAVIGLGVLDRATGLQVIALGPGHLGEGLGREQLAVRAIEHVDKTVLGYLHQQLAEFALDRQVNERQLRGGRVIPLLAGRELEVPHVLARVRPQRHDRGNEQVVAATGAAQPAGPRRAVADADVEQIEFRVPGHRVPHRATAAPLGETRAAPGFRGHGHRGVFRCLGGISRYREETPCKRAGVGVIGRDITAHAHVGAAVADQHLALHDARRTGDGVRARGVDQRLRAPQRLAGLCVQRHQTTIKRARVETPTRCSEPAVHHAAAGLGRALAIDRGIEGPERRAAGGIEGVDHAPRTGQVHHAVDDERRGLDATLVL